MPRLDAPATEQTREVMERQVHHLVRLVDDLLDVSRVMRGKIELRKELVELVTVIARAVETAKPLIETQGHELSISVPAESLLVDADPVRLAQVIGNLLTNSARYSEPNGQIWLSARQDGEQAVLTVRDAGIGIAPDMLPHVFELFVQADHSTSKAHGGLGIGLTLVKNLVEMHGGNVEAKSAGLGQGCEFVVRLPLQKQASPTIQEDILPRPETTSAGHRLLVVDDNQDAALTLAMLLRLSGHEVQVAHRGARALEIAASFQPDLVFLDLGMPGMDGYEVARRLRAAGLCHCGGLVALTGYGQEEDRRRSHEAGFDHHFTKPVALDALHDLLLQLGSGNGARP
jgi:CheY-like chemotaxis protein